MRQEVSGVVLFADVVDSSSLYADMGDVLAKGVVDTCIDLMSGAVQRAGGRVIDRIGDEVFCLFATAEAAIRASCEMQMAIGVAGATGRLPHATSIRVGLHQGPVLLEANRVYGDTVHLARRLASMAKSQQVLASGGLSQEIGKSQIPHRSLGRELLKGARQEVEVLEILWDVKSATRWFQFTPPGPRTEPGTLLVTWGALRRLVDTSRPSLTIGRSDTSGVCVDEDGVSRLHARIELRKGAYWLVDLSTNGTRIVDIGLGTTFIQRDETRLGSKGTIELVPGTDVNMTGAIIEYCVVPVEDGGGR